MDFSYQEEEQAAVDLARKILEDHATNDRLKELEASDAAYDAKLWQDLAQSNLLGTAIPEAQGGSDLGFMALCLLLQEVGRCVAPVPVFPSLVLGALPLARFGSDTRKNEWLPGIASGERIVTAALGELESTDPLAPMTRAEADGDGVRLTGIKTQVACAEQASHILVPARFDDGSIGLFYVEPSHDAVTLTTQGTSDGQPHAQLELAGARVGAEARLDSGGDGAEVLRFLVERSVAARCMMQLGVIERALEMTAAYSCERVQFDRPIGSFQAVHQRAADAYINVEAVRLSAQEAAWRLSRELPAEEHVRVAKFWAAEGGQSVAYACQHLHGGIGIDMDYPLHRYFCWAIQIEHELGSAKHQLDLLGRAFAADGLPGA
ncbi:MAG: acyl-CoA/acyl-ACP dehydrogenase [Deltaproteobacteria bacterium]|nr:acyl-CoA/acyl-ACP dehydrogenase [Deltaproteobacteria bacterium]